MGGGRLLIYFYRSDCGILSAKSPGGKQSLHTLTSCDLRRGNFFITVTRILHDHEDGRVLTEPLIEAEADGLAINSHFHVQAVVMPAFAAP